MPETNLVNALLVAVSALAGAIVIMFQWMLAQHRECRERERELQGKYENVLKLLAPEVFPELRRRATDPQS